MSIFYGILLGLLTVAIFFGVRMGTARMSRNLDPISTMAVAMASYFAKLLFLGVGLYLVARYTDTATVNRPAFGITALLVAVIWIARDIRSYLALKIHLPLPEVSKSPNQGESPDA